MEMQLAHRVAQKSGRMKHLAMCKFSVKIFFKKKYMFYICCEAKRTFLRNKS